jgi:ketosteroid isomerase-like protein
MKTEITTTDAQRTAAANWVARFAERWAPLDAARLADLMHPDTSNLIPPMTAPADRDGVVAHFAALQAQLPGLRLDVERWAVAGDAVFIEWLGSAQLGPHRLEWRGIDRVILRGDRTVGGQAFWDTRQLAERVAALSADAHQR